MAPTVKEPPQSFDFTVETLIVGAGACGLIAALSAMEAGQEVLVIEADAVPSGSTALSAGLIPAAGTKIQQAAGIKDSSRPVCSRYSSEGPSRKQPSAGRSFGAKCS